MKTLSKNYLVKIPKHTTLIYSENKKMITIIGPCCKKSLKLKVKLLFSENKKTITISSYPTLNISNKEKKNLNAIKGTTKAMIELFIIETTTIIYQKLKLIGVGYRASDSEKYNLITLKLGYSHKIYFKIGKNINIFCLKLTKIFIFGNSLGEITTEASNIRYFKKPEPYKGKGILYESEKIKLKEGKKV